MRKFFYLLPLVTIVILGVHFTAKAQQAGEGPKVIRAQAIELVDAVGNVRISIGVSSEGVASISLFDQNSTLRGRLAELEGGATGLFLFDGYENLRGAWTTGNEGQAAMAQFDAQGVVRAAWEITPDGSPVLAMNGPNGSPKLSLQASDQMEAFIVHGSGDAPAVLMGTSRIGGGPGGPALVLYGERSRQMRLSLNLDGDENPMVALHGADGALKGAWMTTSEGIGLTMYDGRARPRVLMGVDPSSDGGFLTYDSSGNVVFQAPDGWGGGDSAGPWNTGAGPTTAGEKNENRSPRRGR